MRTIESFTDWFEHESQKLPSYLKEHIKFAISQKNPRLIFIELDEINKNYELPQNWKNKIEEYYHWVF